VIEVTETLSAITGWRQILLNRGRREVCVTEVRGWVVRGDDLYPVGPEGDLGERYRVLRVISPLCLDTDESLLKMALSN